MSDPSPHAGIEAPDLIDGRTLDQLADYLEADMTPADPAIDSSPECRLALAALRAVETATVSAIEHEAATLPPPSPAWLQHILDTISRNVLPGRTIPLDYPEPGLTLTTTESALRGLIRAVGDDTPGVLIGRCIIDGDVTAPGAPLHVRVDAAVYWGSNIPATAALLRAGIADALRGQTRLDVPRIDVTVHDIHLSNPGTATTWPLPP